ncbi:hypothetical protein K1719_001956 [Acacia pycnantha]|nr:hypothetical protein K1719_001956 [Acacia pycnantha]
MDVSVERFLGKLKSYVRNKAWHEGRDATQSPRLPSLLEEVEDSILGNVLWAGILEKVLPTFPHLIYL